MNKKKKLNRKYRTEYNLSLIEKSTVGHKQVLTNGFFFCSTKATCYLVDWNKTTPPMTVSTSWSSATTDWTNDHMSRSTAKSESCRRSAGTSDHIDRTKSHLYGRQKQSSWPTAQTTVVRHKQLTRPTAWAADTLDDQEWLVEHKAT